MPFRNTDNKFIEFLNNDNAIFNRYDDVIDVHSDMINKFRVAMEELIDLAENSPEKLKLSGLLKYHAEDSHMADSNMLLVWLNIKVGDYMREKVKVCLHSDIRDAFERACHNKFHAILCGRTAYKAIIEEIERRSQ